MMYCGNLSKNDRQISTHLLLTFFAIYGESKTTMVKNAGLELSPLVLRDKVL
jgi:hypothetical protein